LSWNDELKQWLQSLSQAENNKLAIETAESAIDRIKKSSWLRLYKINGDEILLSNAQVLMLIWEALNSKNETHYVSGIDMSPEEIQVRKKRLIEHLIAIQNTYGPNNPACEMGTRNQLVACLDCTHIDVHIASELSLTEEIISYKHAAWCKEKLDEMAIHNPALFLEYVKYYPLRGIPGACEEDAIPPIILTEEINRIQSAFATIIYEENDSLSKKKQLTKSALETILTALQKSDLEEFPGLNISKMDNLNRLAGFLSQINCTMIGPACFGLPVSVLEVIRNNTAELLTNKTTTLESLLEALTVILIKNYDAVSFQARLEKDKDYRLIFSNFDDSFRTLWLQKHWLKIINPIPMLAISGNNKLWVQLREEFIENTPSLRIWIENLPNEQSISFIQEIITNKYHIKNQKIIIEFAFDFALREGHLKGFSATEKIILKNRDLRGIDLSTIDLKPIYFENCNLWLTGILENPTLKAGNIVSHQYNHLWLWLIFQKLEAIKDSQDLLDISRKNELIMEIKAILDNAKKICHKFEEDFFYTPLEYLLIKFPSTIVLEILSEHNNTKLYLSAYALLLAGSNLKIIQMLLQHPQCSSRLLKNRVLFKAVENENREIVQAILDSPYCTKKIFELLNDSSVARGKHGWSNKELSIFFQSRKNECHGILYAAIKKDNVEIVNTLLSSKHCSQKFFEKLSSEGNSILDEAILSCNSRMAQVILDSRFCSTFILTKRRLNGFNPLSLAIKKKSKHNCQFYFKS
jgi:hypothetical protein